MKVLRIVCAGFFILLVAPWKGYSDSYPFWKMDSSLELTDFFGVLTQKFPQQSSSLKKEVLACLTKTPENSAFLGDLDGKTGGLLSEKPGAEFWSWYHQCLSNENLVTDELILNLLKGVSITFSESQDESLSPELSISLLIVPWLEVPTEKQIEIVSRVINYVIPHPILLEMGIETRDYAMGLVEKVSKLQSNPTVENVVRLVLIHAMSTDYFLLGIAEGDIHEG